MIVAAETTYGATASIASAPCQAMASRQSSTPLTGSACPAWSRTEATIGCLDLPPRGHVRSH
jgi:hypothetical protein